jgi:hypothetical protein
MAQPSIALYSSIKSKVPPLTPPNRHAALNPTSIAASLPRRSWSYAKSLSSSDIVRTRGSASSHTVHTSCERTTRKIAYTKPNNALFSSGKAIVTMAIAATFSIDARKCSKTNRSGTSATTSENS